MGKSTGLYVAPAITEGDDWARVVAADLLASLTSWMKEDGVELEFLHDFVCFLGVTKDRCHWAFDQARLNVSK